MKTILIVIFALVFFFGSFSSNLLTQNETADDSPGFPVLLNQSGSRNTEPDNNWEEKAYQVKNIDSIGVTVSPNFRPWPGSDRTQSEFSIDVHPLNENIILFSGNATDWPYTKLFGTGVYWSTDGGANWTGHDIPPFGLTGVDPAVVIGVDGYFYVNFIDTYDNGAQGIAVSTDNGASWTRDTVATPDPRGFLDKNHLMVDKNINSRYANRLYCGWVASNCAEPNTNDIMVSYSTNFGSTWSPSINISDSIVKRAAWGVNLQTAANGDVYAAYAILVDEGNNIEDAIGFSKSTDGGDTTWTAAIVYAAPNFGIRGDLKLTQIAVNSFPSMAVDRSGGAHDSTIYICWSQRNVYPAGSDPDIVLIKSTDGGKTWYQPVRVNDDPINNGKDQYFPWITVDQSTGYPMIVFYDNRETNEFSTGVWMAVSADGGSTWQNIRVSDSFFQPKPIGVAWNDHYQGDYIGIAALNNVAYPVWADDRTGNYQAWMSIVTFDPVVSIDPADGIHPVQYELEQNYPNPFNPITTIQYQLPKASNVEITIFNLLGQQVWKKEIKHQAAGQHEFNIDLSNKSSGIYFYRLEAGEFVQTKKMILMK